VNDSVLPEFDYTPRTRIVCGPNTLDRLGDLTRQHGGHRALLVTDQGLVRAGHADRAATVLANAGLTVIRFDRVTENPTSTVVESCVSVARGAGVDFLVGLGGGSSIDTAKGCNFLLTGGGRMEDYWGVGKATHPMLPLIAIPTTTGTGSECQSFALITQAETHVKMACGDPKAAAKVALLDPRLALSQPRNVTFCTGIDALAHAVESAVSTRRNPISSIYSREAFRLCIRALPRILSKSDDLAAVGQMQLGAAWAGTAIENSMLGAAHAAANPLTRRFGLTHGLAVGLALPHVVRLNGAVPAAESIYADLLRHAGLLNSTPTANAVSTLLADLLDQCFHLADTPPELATVVFDEQAMTQLAQEAAAQWTAQFNPRPLTAEEFAAIYRMIRDDLQVTEDRSTIR